MKPPATCPYLDELATLLRRASRRRLTPAERRRGLELVEWQRGAHSELRRWAGEERDRRRALEP